MAVGDALTKFVSCSRAQNRINVLLRPGSVKRRISHEPSSIEPIIDGYWIQIKFD